MIPVRLIIVLYALHILFGINRLHMCTLCLYAVCLMQLGCANNIIQITVLINLTHEGLVRQKKIHTKALCGHLITYHLYCMHCISLFVSTDG